MMYPDPEKVDRLIELVKEVAAHVHDHEPYAWQYEFYKSTDGDQPVIVVIERYFDQASIDAHVHTKGYQKFSKAISDESLCVRDHKAYFLSQIAGFKRT